MQLELQTGSPKLLRMHRVLCHEFGSEARSAIRTFLGGGGKRRPGAVEGKAQHWEAAEASRLEHHTAAHCQLYSGCFKIVVFVFIFSLRLPNSGKPVAAI